MYTIKLNKQDKSLTLKKIQSDIKLVQQVNRISLKQVGRQGIQGPPGDPATNLVTSVNGEQGAVVLDANDVGADPAGSASAVQTNLTTHASNISNPHSVTASQIGLGNVNNTSDLDKPISTATQSALNNKADISILAPVATSNDYDDLDNLPTLGTAAAANTSDFATAAQGLLADSAVQNLADLGITANVTELNYTDGVTSAIQTQLDNKSAGHRTDTLITNYPAAFTHIETFNTVLSDYYGAGTVSLDTTKTMDGGGSAKIALPTGTTLAGGMRDSFSSAQDWSHKNFSIWVMADDWAKVNEIQLLLLSGSSYSDSTAFRLNIKQYIVSPSNNEWIQLIFNREQFTTVGAAVWTDVQKIIVRGSAISGQTANIWFDQFTVFNEASNGFVSIDFDDGWAEIYTAANYMSTKGLVGSLHVIPSLIGTAGYMTQAQIDDLARRGWDISGHGATNLASLYAISPATAEADVRSMREWLDARGYHGADIYAYPEGANSLAIRNIVGKYFSVSRDVLFISQPSAWVAPMNIHAFAPIESTTTIDLNQRVADTLTKGTWQVITFHKIVTSPTAGSPIEYSMANFQTVIDNIISSGAVCLPKSKVIGRLTASTASNEFVKKSGDTMSGQLNTTGIGSPNGTLGFKAVDNSTSGNYFEMKGSSGAPVFQSAGASAGINFYIRSKGTGQIILNPGANSTQGIKIQNATNSTDVARFDTSNLRASFGGNTNPSSTVDSTGSLGANIRTVSANLTAAATDHTILADATSAALTITLPAASGATRRIYIIKKIDAGTNSVTIDGNASETIDGAVTYSLSTQYKYVTIQSNGSAWFVIGSN